MTLLDCNMALLYRDRDRDRDRKRDKGTGKE